MERDVTNKEMDEGLKYTTKLIAEKLSKIKPISVVSSNIESVKYEKNSFTLEVLFKGGRKYWYGPVKEDVVEELLSAESVGQYFVKNIRDNENILYREV